MNPRLIFFIALVLIVNSSCAFLPWQVSAITNATDVALVATTGKSTTEHAASEIVQKDCQWWRLLYGFPACWSKEQEIEVLLKMHCDTYSWN